MKKYLVFLIGITFMGMISGCAGLGGGRNYIAHVIVEGHPDAVIEYNWEDRGLGTATFLASRRKADDFSFIVKKENCEPQEFSFHQKRYRPSSLFSTVVVIVGSAV